MGVMWNNLHSRGSHVERPGIVYLRGQLLARWSYVRIDSLIDSGLHEAIDQLQQDLNRLHSLIQNRYFTSADLRSTPADPACALESFTA